MPRRLSRLADQPLPAAAQRILVESYPETRAVLADSGHVDDLDVWAALYAKLPARQRATLLHSTEQLGAGHIDVVIAARERSRSALAALRSRVTLNADQAGRLLAVSADTETANGIVRDVAYPVELRLDAAAHADRQVVIEWVSDDPGLLDSGALDADTVTGLVRDAATSSDAALRWRASQWLWERPELRTVAAGAGPDAAVVVSRMPYRPDTHDWLVDADVPTAWVNLADDPSTAPDVRADAYDRLAAHPRSEHSPLGVGLLPARAAIETGPLETVEDPHLLDRILWRPEIRGGAGGRYFQHLALCANPHLDSTHAERLLTLLADTPPRNDNCLAGRVWWRAVRGVTARFDGLDAHVPGLQWALSRAEFSMAAGAARYEPPPAPTRRAPRPADTQTDIPLVVLDTRFGAGAGLVAGTLTAAFGDDSEAWELAFSLIEDFSGTAGELVNTVATLRR